MDLDKNKIREFILLIKDKTNINALELIEKDFYLSMLLSRLNLEEYVFKGGTCLAKVYLDYSRLSEDLDFTFLDQKIFEGKSTKSIKKICKEKINLFGKNLESAGFDFIFEKSNTQYVMLGSNNKMVTFKVWYTSFFTGVPSFIKVQINFLEKFKFKPKKKEVLSLISENKLSKEDRIYFKDCMAIYEKKSLLVYNIKEIVAEKVRSLLTRKSVKSRDAVDLFLIYKKYNIRPEELIDEIVEKIFFAVKMYEKYKNNFISAKEKLKEINFDYNEVKHLVLKDIKKEDYEEFVERLTIVLEDVVNKLDSRK